MVFIRSGNFIAYALIMSCDPSVEQSSPMIISYLKFVLEDGIQGFGEVWSVVVCETTYADFYIVHFISADALIIYNNGAFCILTTSENQSPHIC